MQRETERDEMEEREREAGATDAAEGVEPTDFVEPTEVEQIYELSPVQEAMLFHSLYAPGSGVYVVQLSLRLEGSLDREAFAAAWRSAARRHPILRTAFFWEDLEKPVQVVYGDVTVRVEQQSWRGLAPAEQEERLARHLASRREAGFALDEPPLLAVDLIELGPDRHHFVWSVHHLLIDGWSQGLLMEDLFRFYGAYLAGFEPSLPPARPYKDYVAWLQRQDIGAAERFWRETLEGFDEPTLIADRGAAERTASGGKEGGGEEAAEKEGGFRASRHRGTALSEETSAALAEVGRRHRLTLSTLVQGAWAWVLAGASGSDDVAFGATVAGRPEELPGVETIVGPFINTLPARVRVRPERPLEAWLAAFQEDQADVRCFSYTPLVKVQGWSELGTGRDLFDHILVFENYPLDEALAGKLPGLTVSGMQAAELTNYPLAVTVVPGRRLALDLTYDARRLSGAAAARLLARLTATLEAMTTLLAAEEGPAAARPTSHPSTPKVGDLPRMLPAERQQLMVEWNDRAAAHAPAWASVPEGFLARALERPDAVAAVAAAEGYEETVTYGELARRAAALAAELRRRGLAPEDRVGVAMERSADMPAAVLGVMAAGGAYVPLDPAYPLDRLRYVAESAGIRALVGDGTLPLSELLPPAEPLPDAEGSGGGAADGAPFEIRLPLASSDESFDAPDAFRAPPNAFRAPPDAFRAPAPGSLAYVLYTSGSTGKPKGIGVSHGALGNFLASMARRPGLGEDDVLLAVTTLSFDIAGLELYLPLLTGARLVIAGREAVLEGAELARLLARHRVTSLQATPATWRQLLASGWEGTNALAALCGGEALERDLADALADRAGEVWNLYGPTETTVWSAAGRVVSAAGPVPVGPPIDNTELYLADRRLRAAAPGAAGELLIGGSGLARGYLGRPGHTAERFVPHPWSVRPGARLYRTGDLARQRPDGRLDFLGRIDHQVKVRGFRVELGEIEEVLSGHPEVERGVVVTEGTGAAVRLVAFVSPAARAEEEVLDVTGLRTRLGAYLGEHLPPYMVPAAFVSVAELPLTPNGKVDRKALAALAPEATSGAERVAPRNELEALLVGIWADILERDPHSFGVEDSFFELGGHSLLTTQVASRIRDAFEVEISLRRLFEVPTVAELAREVESRRRGGGPVAPPITPTDRGRPLVLSFSQQRLWFLEQLEPGSAFYNIPLAARLTGELDTAALGGVVEALVRRHESLRTTFGDRDGRPFQRVAPAESVVPADYFRVLDLSSAEAGEREETAREIATAEARRPYDVAEGPLARFLLARLGDDEHLLLINLHHIIADGWSGTVLLGEMQALYRVLAAGEVSVARAEEAAGLAPLPIAYADYAAWQREWLSGEVFERQLAFWKEHLEGVGGLELPIDRPRPAVETFRGSNLTFRLSPRLSEDLEDLARGLGATLFTVLMAAFKTMLYRVTGEGDLPVGTPIANRTRGETEGVVGFFANTLVMRSRLTGRDTFEELTRAVRETAFDAYDHQEMPFERLVEEISPERDMSRNPLFQVMVVLQNQPWPTFDLGGVTLQAMDLDTGTAKFDLTLFWQSAGGALNGLLEYNSDLFDRTTAERLAGYTRRLLEAVADDPERSLLELPMLSPAQRHQLLQGWNDSEAAEIDETQLVHRRAAARAERTPEATALVFGDEHFSFGEVEARANRLARGLARERGIGPEVLVGISTERSAEMVIALLAVLKAGGAAVALDPAYPKDRLSFIIREAGLGALLTDAAMAPLFADHAGIQLRLDQGEPFPEESAAPYDGGASPDSPIYAIYTSGSTGQPKGILVPHRAFAGLADWLLAGGGWGTSLAPRAKTVQSSTFGFCVSFQEIFTSFASGACLVVPDELTRRDIEALVALLGRHRVERLHLPFAALKHIAEAASSNGAEGASLPSSLREIITAGEQLQVNPAVRGLFDALPAGATLHNQYGASETHVVTALTLGGAPSSWPALPSVGRPVDRVAVRLLDPRLEPAPIGVPGELYASGACVARGYLADPVLTAQKMVPDPYSPEPGARMYRTGDSARALADGQIEYHGRIDTQVKIRGFRVELGEIDNVLAARPEVHDAAVVAKRLHSVSGGGGEPVLVAYVVLEQGVLEQGVLEEGGEPSAVFGPLRESLAEVLPDYMLPSAFVAVDFLPLNANGKLDQAALPEPEAVGADRPRVAPRTEAEAAVAEVWAEVLGRPVESLSVEDSFFDLGGHSLLATQVVSRLRRSFRIDLPVRVLFEAPVLEGLARRVEALAAEVPAGEAAPSSPIPAPAPAGEALRPSGRRTAPLSFAQQRLWFIDRLLPGSPLYNMFGEVEIGGDLDLRALGAAFASLVERHEALRTVFPEESGGPVQRVLPASPPALPRVDLSGLPGEREAGEAREGEASRLARKAGLQPFDLAAGPLLRLRVLDLGGEDGEKRHRVLLTVHHIVFDGWSWAVLFRELGLLYTAHARGAEADLPPLPVQYADFAAAQHASLSSPAFAAQLAWWRERLAGAPQRLDLPRDHPRPALGEDAGSRRGGGVSRSLGPALTARIRALADRRGATPAMVLMTAFEALLARYSEGRKVEGHGAGAGWDVPLAVASAGRSEPEVEGLIGFFVNTLLLRPPLAPELGFGAAVDAVRETALEAYAREEVPFDRLVEELAPRRDLESPPFSQVMFAYQNFPRTSLEAGGLTFTFPGGRAADGGTKFELTLQLEEVGDRLDLYLEHALDLFDPTTARRFLGHLEGLVRAGLDDPEAPMGALPMLSAAERHQMRREWNDSAVLYPRDRGLAALTAERAGVAPEAVVLVDGDEHVTYAELLRRSGAVARRLRARGVGLESRVGLAVERSARLVEAMLGIARAGGAYVPLDPAYPASRLTWMVEDAGVEVLVTESAPGTSESRPAFRHLEEAGLAVLDLDEEEREGEEAADEADEAYKADEADEEMVEAAGEGLAYVIYTSGSTGTPKGVGVPQRGVSRLVSGTEYVAFHPGERMAQVSNASFDAITFEVWGALLNAGRLVVIDRETLLSTRALAEAFRSRRIDSFFLTASLFNQVAADEPAAFARARNALFGGEAADGRRLRELLAGGAPPERLVNGYGPTECTTFALTEEVREVPAGAVSVPIGRPIANTRGYVLDRRGREAAPGTAGELFLGGDGVARGYLGRPALTAERFVPDPFSGEAGARLYRTGDVVKHLADGRVDYLGRADHQVKMRGYRIELGEIEAALRDRPEVKEAVVLMQETGGGHRLTAFLVPAAAASARMTGTAGEEELGRRLRDALQGEMPSYMVPAAFVAIDALPLTPNGKLDRRALLEKAPSASGPGPGGAPAAGSVAIVRTHGAARAGTPTAGTEHEALIIALWSELLDVPAGRIGPGDDFFALGGHSLLATRLSSRLNEILGVDVPVRTIFDDPDLASFARRAAALAPHLPPAARELAAPHLAARELPAVSPAPAGAAGPSAAGGLETILSAVWAEVLGDDAQAGGPAVGPHGDFFALGGKAEQLPRLAERARRALERLGSQVLTPERLRRNPTPAALAASLAGAVLGAEPPPLAAGARPEHPPLSFAQQRLWFLDRLAPGRASYNLHGSVEIGGELDPEILARAFSAVVERHEVLRTVLVEVDGGPVQRVEAPAPLPLPRIDLSRLEADDRPATADRLFAAERGRPFDLARGPVLRARLLVLGEEGGVPLHKVLLVFHHAAFDGWSWGVLFRELIAFYEALAEGRPAPLPPLPVQYADYALWQREWLRGDVLAEQIDWWRRTLSGAPAALRLPRDRQPDDAAAPRCGAGHAVRRLDSAVTAGLHLLARQGRASLPMVVMAGFQALLARYGAGWDVPLGVAVAGREPEAVEGLIGFFVNTVVIRGRLASSLGFREAVDRVREAALGAYAHQQVPFDRLVEELAPVRDPDRPPLVEVMFGFQSFPRTALEVRGLTFRPPEVVEAPADSKFDLTLQAAEEDGRLAVSLEFDRGQFNAATVHRLLAHLEALLRRGAEAPEAALGSLPLLAAAELHQLTAERGDAPSEAEGWARLIEMSAGAAAGDPHRRVLGGGSEPAPLEIGDLRRPPRGRTEHLLADLWSELLGIDRSAITAADGFFDLGGHSLLATKLISRLRAGLGVDLPVRDVFEEPVLARLARRIDRLTGEGPEGTAEPGTGAAPARPLSFSQERLWFLDRLAPGSPAYNMPVPMAVRGRLDVEALAAALAAVLRRHEVLRSVYLEGETGPVQVVRPQAPDAARRLLPVADLTALGDGDREEEARRLRDRESVLPFDLDRGPVIRAALLRLERGRHLLLLNMHHIASDGWSLGVLVREMGTLYRVAGDLAGSGLEPLPLQYADFAERQRRELSGERLRRELGFWRGHLEGVSPTLDLPTDRPYPAVESYRGASVSFRVPASRTAGLRRLAEGGEGTTLFAVLLTAWQAYLSRLTGQKRLLVGSPTAGRNRLDIEGLVGFFVNTLPLAADLRERPSFREALARSREAAVAAFSHQDLPFERLVEALNLARDPSRPPLIQVLFSFQNLPFERMELPGLTLALDLQTSTTSKFELDLTLSESEGSLHGDLAYRTDLFDEVTVRRMVEGWGRFLEQAAAHPELPTAALDILGRAARRQLVGELNDSGEAFAGLSPGRPDLSERLDEAVRRQAVRTPDAEALRAPDALRNGERSLTYAELTAASRRLAAVLRDRWPERGGVGPETVVAVLFERSAEMVIALLAVLEAGAAYLPLDPEHPAERLAAVTDDARPALLLTTEALKDRVPRNVEVLTLEEAEASEVRADDPDAGAGPDLGPDALAYVIYTSGSTGRPKGVMGTHRGIVNRLAWGQSVDPIGPGDRVLQKTPYTFDVSVWELFWPLATGACLVMARPGGHRDPSYLVDVVRREGITTLHFVPSMLSLFLDAEGLEGLTDLRRAVASGEELPAAQARRFARRLPGVRLSNYYGPTETAVEVAAWRCGPDEAGRVPIGRPVAGVRLHVVDAAARPVPLGVAGELWIAGTAVGRGYRGRPALTAASFVPDPFSPVPGARAYRSGDLVRRRHDGALVFLGRNDHQVKVRGLRIELGEIEAALAAHPDVARAVVLPTAGPGGDRLAAYVVPASPDGKAGDAGRTERLGRHLRRVLPSAMVPSVFVFLAELPLTPSGKLDRAALPAPERPVSEHVAPRNPLEERLAEVWRQVLEVERVGVHDDFFALGGHSLLAARLASRLSRALEREVPLQLLFERPTVAGLAEALEARSGESPNGDAGEGSSIPPLRALPRPQPQPLSPHGGIPLSSGQSRMWFLHRLAPESSAYNMYGEVEIRGALRPELLRRAFEAVVDRHEALRTVFAEGEGGPRQVILPPAPLPMPRIDLTGLAAASRSREEARLFRAERDRPFDLARGPVLRVRLVRVGAERHRVLLALHHISFDGWSWGVLFRELTAAYEAFAGGAAFSPPPLPLQYADYALWQHSWRDGAAMEEQVSWWREELRGAPARLELPRDRRPGSPEAARRAGSAAAGRWLTPELGARLGALARERRSTPAMLYLGALQTLLARFGAGWDVPVATASAGRERRELEGLIGFFVNTLVLRSRLAPEMPFTAVLDRARRTALGAYSHADVPFERLIERIGRTSGAAQRDLAGPPFSQVMFGYQSFPREPLAVAGLTFVQPEREGLDTAGAKAELTLQGFEEGGRPGLALEYDTGLFDTTTAHRLADALTALLAAVADDADRPVGDLPLLAPAAAHQLTAEWNDTRTAFPADKGLGELFAEVAEARPDTVAVVDGDSHLTFGELDRRSARLARELRDRGVGARGVGAESRVALAAARSEGLAVAVLGILRAGGAYVPLDPALPPARLAWMLEDAGIETLVMADPLEGLDTGGLEVVDLALLDLGADAASIAARPTSAPEAPSGGVSGGVSGGDGPAYVIYTSGSTGTPKGVEVPQRGVARLVLDTDYVRLAPGDRIALASTPVFDAITFELWGALLTGATAVILDRETLLDPRALGGALARRRIDTLFLTTALFNQVALEEPAAFSGLRELLFGGEAVDPGRVRRVLAGRAEGRGPQRLLHVYGPTETTTYATWHPIRHVPEGAPTVPIGGPIANTVLHVVDRRGRPAMLGTAGELLLGGPGTARGYLGRPALTAERFVPDPFAVAESGAEASGKGGGGRLYRTGDVVRQRPDGAIEFVGRVDHQIKVRGFRIELGEVESALRSLPAVREAVVLALPSRGEDGGEGGDLRLAAYVVPAGEGDAASEISAERKAELPGELKSRLAASLPAYMVPDAVVLLDRLPLNANGKVDRKALPAPDFGAAASAGGASSALLGPTEELMAEVWAAALNVARVGPEDEFFELGGHSLLAAQLTGRARDAFGVEVPVRTLFENPTLRSFARAVDELRAAGAGEDAPPLVRFEDPAGEAGPAPASFAQQRLWFLDRLQGADPAYAIPLVLRLHGPLSPRAFAEAARALAERHESLRTVFRESRGEAVQVVLPAARPELPVVDLSALGLRQDEAEALAAERLAARETRRPFDLAEGPLMRLRLVRFGPEEHLLLVTVHHIVADGWSMGILSRELGVLYEAAERGEEAVLPPLPIRYGDFARWQRRAMSGEALERRIERWRRRLEGLPPVLDLPSDHPRPPRRSTAGGQVVLRLPDELTASLKALTRERGVTLYMALLAAWQVLLARLSGETDFAVGAPSAGRDRVETEGLIGFFLNTLTLRANLSGNPTYAEVLGRVRETVLDAFADQDVPFERLVDALRVERSLSVTPLFQVFFQLLNLPAREVPAGSLRLETVAADEAHDTKFDLSFTFREIPGEAAEEGGLEGVLLYNRAMWEPASARRMADAFARLLAAAVAEPERSVRELPLLSPEEEREILALGDGEEIPLAERTLDAAFAARAAKQPEAVALVAGGEHLSYGALAARVRRLAGRLRARGVGPESIVALAAGRSSALVTAMLGVLEAEGAYSVIDPGLPEERLRILLETLETRLVLAGPEAEGRLPQGPWEVLGLDAASDTEAEAGSAADREAESAPTSSPASSPAAESAFGAGADRLAYVSFTSGSTGRPKGVLVPHRGVMTYLDCYLHGLWMREPGETVLQLASFSFDASTRDLLGSLLVGARVVVLGETEARDPRVILPTLERERATAVAAIVPTFLSTLVEAAKSSGRTFPLRLLLVSGELFLRSLAEDVMEVFGAPVLVNQYGATEATITSNYLVLTEGGALREDVWDPREGAYLGRPVPGMRLRILGTDGRPAPLGSWGEILFGGPGVTRGYLGSPALTAQRFVPDPTVSSDPEGLPGGGRLYRTGDLGRYRSDGNLELAGRIDHQFKLRGMRIEPGEVESALEEAPGVARAVVLLRDDPGIGPRLVAYVIPEAEDHRERGVDEVGAASSPASSQAPDEEGAEQPGPEPYGGAWTDDLRRRLARTLPAHLVPDAVVALDAFPRTSTGKLDRRALPAPEVPDRPETAAEAPRDRIEEALVRVWSEVLGGRAVGLEDSFFDLGGHSLLGVRLVDRIREELRVRLPLAVLFQHPTVAGLAERIRRGLAEPGGCLVQLAEGTGGRAGGTAGDGAWHWVHGMGGNVHVFLPLARCSRSPLYAFQAPGVDGESEPLESVEALAERYVGELRKARPAGPYRLGGWSMGGLIAYEMARLLTEVGEEVESLVLVDTRAEAEADPALLEVGDNPAAGEPMVAAFARHWGLKEDSPEVRRRMQPLFRLFRRHYLARVSYRPPSYAGEVVLVRADDSFTAEIEDPTLGWGERSPNVRVVHIPGDHYTVLEGDSAEALARLCDGADESGADSAQALSPPGDESGADSAHTGDEVCADSETAAAEVTDLAGVEGE